VPRVVNFRGGRVIVIENFVSVVVLSDVREFRPRIGAKKHENSRVGDARVRSTRPARTVGDGGGRPRPHEERRDARQATTGR